jgi:hypothetical protein
MGTTKRLIGALAGTCAVVATLSHPVTGLVANLKLGSAHTTVAAPTTSTAPESDIRPLSIRPVVSAFVTTPDQCPPLPVDPPDRPIRACDFAKTAVYELGPEALRVDLTNVGAFRNPLTGKEMVQMFMTAESAERFSQYSGDQVGKQVAFVRGGTVVWGPKISGPIDGEVLQLYGDFTPEQALRVARMLRDES